MTLGEILAAWVFGGACAFTIILWVLFKDKRAKDLRLFELIGITLISPFMGPFALLVTLGIHNERSKRNT
jgi:hypothetical protein